MSTFKEGIKSAIFSGDNTSKGLEAYYLLDKITDRIWWAWKHWDDDVLATYYKGDKPEKPTEDFIENWIDNNDFQAEGYDEKELEELFGTN